MSLLRNIAGGLRSLMRREQVDRELDEELGLPRLREIPSDGRRKRCWKTREFFPDTCK